MPGFIPENVLDQILDRCDIAEIIASYIPLRKAGRSYKALCPFHHEKTPSFVVNPDKGIFHCFGCGVGGNAFSFIMKYEKLEFPEAARMLAKKAGVALPESFAETPKGASPETEGIYKIHELAAVYFQDALMAPSGRPARDYLAGRGVSDETAGKFRLGFAPDSWDGLLSHLQNKGFDKGVIEKAGLIVPRPGATGHYDRFRKRLIFPIFNQRDKVIAFAGRVFDDSQPKYMNSPETAIYNKSRTLFGLNFSKNEMSRKDAAVIVEGYLDHMIPYQAGLKNIAASCGTALTAEHARLLKRRTRNVIMVYDPDKAGEMATLRGLDVLVSEDMSVKIVRLPQGYDPDGFVRKYGIKEFLKLTPVSLIEYKIGVLKAVHGSDSPESVTKIAGEMLKTISKVSNAVLKSEYLKRLAESLAVGEDDLRMELNKIRREYDGGYRAEALPLKYGMAPLSAADKIIIGLMIEDNSLIPAVKEKIDCGELSSEYAGKIVDFIFKANRENKPVSYSTLINNLEINGLDSFLSEIAAAHSTFTDKKRNLEDCIAWIKKDKLKRNLDDLRGKIRDAQSVGEQGRITELVAQYDKLIKARPNHYNGRLKIQR